MDPLMIEEGLKIGKHCFSNGRVYCPSTSGDVDAYVKGHLEFEGTILQMIKFCPVCGRRITGLGDKIFQSPVVIELKVLK